MTSSGSRLEIIDKLQQATTSAEWVNTNHTGFFLSDPEVLFTDSQSLGG